MLPLVILNVEVLVHLIESWRRVEALADDSSAPGAMEEVIEFVGDVRETAVVEEHIVSFAPFLAFWRDTNRVSFLLSVYLHTMS